jgi:hypothetical protein
LIGLVVGLGVGIVVGYEILPTHNGAGVNNQVQVSGTVSETQTGDIQFSYTNGTEAIDVPSGQVYIVSVSLTGGNTYYVLIETSGATIQTWNSRIFIPSGVTTFTANF